MIILKEIREDRWGNDAQINKQLINLMGYLNSVNLYDQLPMMPTKKKIHIDYIRRFRIILLNNEDVFYEIRYDGISGLGKGKGITRTIPIEIINPYMRIMKLKSILNKTK